MYRCQRCHELPFCLFKPLAWQPIKSSEHQLFVSVSFTKAALRKTNVKFKELVGESHSHEDEGYWLMNFESEVPRPREPIIGKDDCTYCLGKSCNYTDLVSKFLRTRCSIEH